jgi:thermitase
MKILALCLALSAAPEAPPRLHEPIPAGPSLSGDEVRGRFRPDALTDPFLGKQWWLINEGQPDEQGQPGVAGAEPAILAALTHVQTQKPVVLAILDSGLDLTHEDIDPACLWVNEGESGTDAAGRDRRTNGVDDDGNGYIDDVHGWNFVDESPTVQEDQYHGTHCGGLVTAVANNARGIAGAYPPVKIMLVKIFGLGHLLSSEEIARGVRYAVDNGAKVLSNSYGTPSYVPAFKQVVEYTRDRGALFVCAAGNSRKNLDVADEYDYPSCYGIDNQLVVGASDNRDASSQFSNFGTVVDLAAPGQAMFSLMPKSRYRAFSGTSQACPLVAGAAALLWSQHPQWTYSEVKQRLLDSADQRPALRRWVRTAARLNLDKAVRGVSGDRLPTHDFAAWHSAPHVLESRHPYQHDQATDHVVEVPGARFLRLHFRRFDTEANYDRLSIHDAEGRHVETLDGAQGETWSEVVPGSRAHLRFVTSSVIDGWGWAIDRVEYLP